MTSIDWVPNIDNYTCIWSLESWLVGLTIQYTQPTCCPFQKSMLWSEVRNVTMPSSSGDQEILLWMWIPIISSSLYHPVPANALFDLFPSEELYYVVCAKMNCSYNQQSQTPVSLIRRTGWDQVSPPSICARRLFLRSFNEITDFRVRLLQFVTNTY